MILNFIDVTILDVLDILLVAYIIYQVYYLIRGTVAIKIFYGILAIYLLWKLVTALQMEMLSELLGQFIGVGVIALLIVFQQELRQFLLFIGDTNLNTKNNKFINKLLPFSNENNKRDYSELISACLKLAKTNTGALIVITNDSDPLNVVGSYETLNAKISAPLIESVFHKSSPLHDGAIVVKRDQILVARAILPVSSSKKLQGRYGTRHRAALGLSELIDAYIIVISEETGNISLAYNGQFSHDLNGEDLRLKISSKP